jgi:hypothetical protein
VQSRPDEAAQRLLSDGLRTWDEDVLALFARLLRSNDIAGSTEKAIELGDARWRALLSEHHTRVRGTSPASRT